jgi:hypothetical protein
MEADKGDTFLISGVTKIIIATDISWTLLSLTWF